MLCSGKYQRINSSIVSGSYWFFSNFLGVFLRFSIYHSQNIASFCIYFTFFMFYVVNCTQ